MSCISLWPCITAGKCHPKLAYVLRCFLPELVAVCLVCSGGCSYLCLNVYLRLLRGHDLSFENKNLCVTILELHFLQIHGPLRSTWMIWLVPVRDLHANNVTLYFEIEKFQPCVHHPRGPSGGKTCSITVKTTASPRKSCSTAAWCGASSPGPPQTRKVENNTALRLQISATQNQGSVLCLCTASHSYRRII